MTIPDILQLFLILSITDDNMSFTIINDVIG